MKNTISPLLWGGFAFVVIVLINGFVFKFDAFTALKSYGEDPTYKVYSLELPDTLCFAGVIIPFDSPDLKERLDRELLVNTYWQSNMMLLLKRSNKWFPLIESILKKEGVPVLESVAANLLAICPDFPTPVIKIFPLQFEIFVHNS